MPPALLGAAHYGPKGVIAGTGLGSVAFGLAALVLAFRTVGALERGNRPEPDPEPEVRDAARPDTGAPAPAPSSGMPP